MDASLPNFLIIGAQKSGTTSLAVYLRAHPQVFVSATKELHYFTLNYDKGIDWYKAQFSGATTERAVGEATPTYMCFEEVPERLASALPEAKLIAILRNPVDRAYSHYWHNRSRDRESLTFVDALAAEPERMASNDPVERKYRNHSYLERGRYLEQLQRVCQYYPREALQVLLFEDLCDAPQETFQRVCRFLEVDDTFIPPNLGAAFNQYVAVRSGALQRISRSLRIRRMRGISRAINRMNLESSSYPELDPALRAELERKFEKDNAALAAWLGKDLSNWNRQPARAI